MTLDAKRLAQLEKCEAALGIFFNDVNLLEQALTHSSYANERLRDLSKSNERLEFFGDSVLSFAVSWYLYDRYRCDEGALSKMRAAAVCEDSLYVIARHYGIEEFMHVGGAVVRSGGLCPKSIVADCMEAVIGAICLDKSVEDARSFVLKCLECLTEAGDVFSGRGENPKSLLQEFFQKKYKRLPEYRVEGVRKLGDNSSSFDVTVSFDGKSLATGVGSSQKEAEKNAASAALVALNVRS